MVRFRRTSVWLEILMLLILIWLMFVTQAHPQRILDEVRPESNETKFALQEKWNETATDRMDAIEKHLDNTDTNVTDLSSNLDKILGGLIALATLGGFNLVVQFKKRTI